MSYRKVNIWKSVDWTIVILYIILIIGGWFSIYGASYEFGLEDQGMFDLSGRAGMQLVWMTTSLTIAFIILMLDSDIYDIFANFAYVLIILLLIVTIFFSTEIRGSRSWLVIGSFRMQPAEFAKFAVALAVAKYMNLHNFRLNIFKNLSIIAIIIGLPMVLILLQKETGSALVYLAFLLVLYREGMSGSILFSGFCAVLFFILGIKYSDTVFLDNTPLGEFIVLILILFFASALAFYYKKEDSFKISYPLYFFLGLISVSTIVYLIHPFNLVYVEWLAVAVVSGFMFLLAYQYWKKEYFFIAFFVIGSVGFLYSVNYVFDEVLQPHQQIRIKVSLGMEDDPSGAGYNVNQSKIAIGSGGLIGKGFLNGTQTKLKYVPEQDTDFIFCTVGEEQGFLGSSTVLILFGVLIIRLIFLAERQRTTFNRVYGYSVASILFFHLAINIGMVIGLTPVIGIPLPFFSYGGSSLWGFTILLFIFLKLDATRGERF